VEGSSLKADPQKIATGDEAQHTDQRYPHTGDNVDAAFGEGADTAPLAPAAAQEGVEAEGESDEAGKGEEETGGEGRAHADASNGA
jgi:hypothetical protein